MNKPPHIINFLSKQSSHSRKPTSSPRKAVCKRRENPLNFPPPPPLFVIFSITGLSRLRMRSPLPVSLRYVVSSMHCQTPLTCGHLFWYSCQEFIESRHSFNIFSFNLCLSALIWLFWSLLLGCSTLYCCSYCSSSLLYLKRIKKEKACFGLVQLLLRSYMDIIVRG
jgi:hypothetical protein